MTWRPHVLVVDDEEHAREDLAFLLDSSGRVGNVVVVGSAADALVAMEDAEFEVIFLDIRMPGLDGMQLAKTLGRFSDPPSVVFVSAYEEHAVAAFAVDAADYLLKPVSTERLATTLDRLETRQPGATAPTTAASPGQAASKEEPADLPFVAVEQAGRTILIDRTEIRYVEAEGDYVRIHTYKDAYLLPTSLGTLAERWAPHGFIRTHRSYMINLRHVVDISPYFNQTLMVRMADQGKTSVPVSRRRVKVIRDKLGLTG